MKSEYHIPILVDELLSFLKEVWNSSNSPIVVDATLGDGGHTLAFLKAYPNLSVVAFDRDPEMRVRACSRIESAGYKTKIYDSDSPLNEQILDGGVLVVPEPFSTVSLFLRKLRENSFDVRFILFDLGVSLFHFMGAKRGFSYRDDDLDMRLAPDLPLRASDILNTYTEEELARIFYEYGEERHSRRIARAIQSALPVTKANQLAEIVMRALPYKKGSGVSRVHPATKVFQSLRIAVNRELEELETVLKNVPSELGENSMLAFLTFHSLEDRMVKQRFKEIGVSMKRMEKALQKESRGYKNSDIEPCIFRILTDRPISPTEDEIAKNPASRSCRLRVIFRSATGETASEFR